MQKRGQVTIFIVIGIVVLFIAAALFFIVNQSVKEDVEQDLFESGIDVSQIKNQVTSFVENCLTTTITPALYLTGAQGGMIYNDDPQTILLTDYGAIQYSWLNGKKIISKSKAEEDLAVYLENNVNTCLEDFPEDSYNVEHDYTKADAKVTFQQKNIILTIDLPTIVSTGSNNLVKIDTYTTSLPTSFGNLFSSAESLIDNKQGDIGITELSNLVYEPTILPFDESVTIYSLKDEQDSIKDLSFMFAVRDDNYFNYPPSLDYVPDQTLRVGDKWELTLTAEDKNKDPLTFTSSNNNFPIAKDGTISLIAPKQGFYQVTYTVEDLRGEKDSQDIKITVLEQRPGGPAEVEEDNVE